MAHNLRKTRNQESTADSSGNFSFGNKSMHYPGFQQDHDKLEVWQRSGYREHINHSRQQGTHITTIQERPYLPEMALCNYDNDSSFQRQERQKSGKLPSRYDAVESNDQCRGKIMLHKVSPEQERDDEWERKLHDKLQSRKVIHKSKNYIKGLPKHRGYMEKNQVTETGIISDYSQPRRQAHPLEKRSYSSEYNEHLDRNDFYISSNEDSRQSKSVNNKTKDRFLYNDNSTPENYEHRVRYEKSYSKRKSLVNCQRTDPIEISRSSDIDMYEYQLPSTSRSYQHDVQPRTEWLQKADQPINYHESIQSQRDHSQYNDHNIQVGHQNIGYQRYRDNSDICHRQYGEYSGHRNYRNDNNISNFEMKSTLHSFHTMHNAKRVAKQLGLLFSEEKDTVEEMESANKLQMSRIFRGRKRKCWSKYCWSSGRHSHSLCENIHKRDDERNHFDHGYLDYNTVKRKIDHQRQELKEHTHDLWNGIKAPFVFWSSDLKRIEGHHGTGVLSYFLFLRWMVYVNLLMTVLVMSFIVIPEIVFHYKEQNVFNNSLPSTLLSQALDNIPECRHCNVEYATDFNYTTKSSTELLSFCSSNYTVSIEKKDAIIDKLQEFLQGTGWMELTPMFIGWYKPTIMRNIDVVPKYDLPITYLLVTISYFLLCLILMVFYTKKSIRESVLKAESQLQRYCNMVFSGWDFSIEDRKLAEIKHGNILQKFRSHLAEARRHAEVSQWSTKKKIQVTFMRVLINVFVISVLGLSGYLIYQSILIAEQEQGGTGPLALLTEYLPSIIITALNLFLPLLFGFLAKFEQYSLSFTVKITLIRCVFSQLASVCVLIGTLHGLIMCEEKTECGNGIGQCNAPMCWETYVGQQIYKLVMLDFAIVVLLTFLIGYPRKLMTENCECKLAQFIGKEEFDIPRNVLSLVYSQTLCWLGAFYSPFLPLLSLIKYIAIFYLKKFSLFVNCVPAKESYKASRSNTFFMIVSMLSYLIGLFAFIYSISIIVPSKGCGPFRIYESAWDTVRDFINGFPPQVIAALQFIGSAGFGIPAFVILSLLLYYYLTISSTYGQMAGVLKDHLLVEGRDKHFLLKKLMIILRQPEM